MATGSRAKSVKGYFDLFSGREGPRGKVLPCLAFHVRVDLVGVEVWTGPSV